MVIRSIKKKQGNRTGNAGGSWIAVLTRVVRIASLRW